MASVSKASAVMAMAPARMRLGSSRVMPSKRSVPRPPAPIQAATVARLIVVTDAVRKPAMITGSASGQRTLSELLPAGHAESEGRLQGVAGSTPRSPVAMLRTRKIWA